MRYILLLFFSLSCLLLLAQVQYIPTVVHVLHFDEQEDMTQLEVDDFINYINIGLRGLSENNIVSREIFDTLWADTEIQLCLATIDQNGNITNGIIHQPIDTPIQSGDFFRTKGESLPWDVDLYLNIWISSMGPGSETSGGITTSPTVPHLGFPNPYIGIMLNKDSYNYYQIAIHEVGHFFGLKHLYQDDIDDTPCSNNAINPEPECNSTFLTLNTCSDEPPFWNGVDPPDMIENYMEYYGNCSKMFTYGQKDKMRDYADSYYWTMINSQPACDITIDIVELNNKLSLSRVYPNPTKHIITIENETPFLYYIMNIQGKILQNGTGGGKLNLDVSYLPNGVFFIKVKGKRSTNINKFIKS